MAFLTNTVNKTVDQVIQCFAVGGMLTEEEMTEARKCFDKVFSEVQAGKYNKYQLAAGVRKLDSKIRREQKSAPIIITAVLSGRSIFKSFSAIFSFDVLGKNDPKTIALARQVKLDRMGFWYAVSRAVGTFSEV